MDSPLRVLADEFGPVRVWKVGMEVFGYPPTWEPSVTDLLRLQTALKG